jgi:hypothetical protein
MKQYILRISCFNCLVYFLTVLNLWAVPEEVKINIMEGVVTDAIWRDEIIINKTIIGDKSTNNINKKDTLSAQCLVILSNVKGVSLKESQDLTRFISNSNYPIDNFIRRLVINNKLDFDNGAKLLISIPVNSVQNIKIGSKIVIHEYNAVSESGSYLIKLEKCIVDGKVLDHRRN